MKTRFKVLLSLLLLALPAVVQAQCFNYTTNNGAITITGYTCTNGVVTIPNCINGLRVTSIGTGAFQNCANLTSVSIPNSVTNIGDWAFDQCISLANLTIGTNVTSIGAVAFNECLSLANVTIPNSVSSIAGQAFSFCYSLTNVTIGKSVASIGEEAFYWCSSLTVITVDPQNTNYSSVDGVLFNKSQTALIQYPISKAGTSYTLPNSLTNIGDYAFADCNLTSVMIPNNITSIGVEAFYECSSLTNVMIGNSVTSIEEWAFAGCGLTSVYFKGNAPNLGYNAFDNDVTVYYLPGTTGWGTNFGGCPTALWFIPNPLILNSGFGVQTNGFGFMISWATNIPIVVEACTNPANPAWSPVATNTLTGGSSYFSDPKWTNYPARFYRLRSP
jgi:hypothetical protein